MQHSAIIRVFDNFSDMLAGILNHGSLPHLYDFSETLEVLVETATKGARLDRLREIDRLLSAMNSNIDCLLSEVSDFMEEEKTADRGWSLNYVFGSGLQQIEKVDDLGKFASDADAVADARSRAAAGDWDAARAVRMHDDDAPALVEFFKASRAA